MPNKYAQLNEYERIRKFIEIKSNKTLGSKVRCSMRLLIPLNFSQRARLEDELREKGISVEWIRQL